MPVSPWVQNMIPFPRLLGPTILLGSGIYHFVMTILEIVFVERHPAKLLHITQVRYKSFARFWTYNGAAMSEEMPGPFNDLVSQCRGLVLDIGPGSGELLKRFNPECITEIYGAEPAADLHAELLKNAHKAGFGDKYHALLCGGEPESLIPALHNSGILGRSATKGTVENGVFDEICCLRVLCGVPHPKATIKGLYSLLKPGGRMVVCEHVVNPWRTEGSLSARAMQFIYSIAGWSFFLGGCELQRHTHEYLQEAGEWEKFQLQYVEPKNVVPFVVGELIRKR